MNARRNRYQTDQGARHFRAKALFFKKAGIVSVGFRHREREIEIAHGHDLAELGVGDALKYANGFLHPPEFSFFGCDLLRSDGYRLK